MALHWDITACADSAALTADDDAASNTDAMIWATMGVGIGRITEENWPEFYARLKTSGYYGDQITPELVRRYVGLSTNVSNETRLQWLKRVVNRHMDDLVVDAKRATQDATA